MADDDDDPLRWGIDPGGWWSLHLGALLLAALSALVLQLLQQPVAAALVVGVSLVVSGLAALRGGRALPLNPWISRSIDERGIDAQRGWAVLMGLGLVIAGAYVLTRAFVE